MIGDLDMQFIGDQHDPSETDMPNWRPTYAASETDIPHRRPTCLRSPIGIQNFRHVYLNIFMFTYFLLIYIHWYN